MPLILESIRSNPTNEENAAPNSKSRFTRSPHLYYRQSFELPDRYYPNKARAPKQQERLPLSELAVSLDFEASRLHDSEYFDSDSRSRYKPSPSSSDSGTEADDERGSLLKGLPAPPTRPRKGLKVSNDPADSAVPSPLLTPTYIDIERRKQVLKGVSDQRGGTHKTVDDDELNAIREKYTKRRRAELLRRLSETACLMIVGYLSFRGAGFDLTLLGRKSGSFTPLIEDAASSSSGLVKLLYHALLISIIYLAHPISLLWHRGLGGLQIPAAFDPAPILYPVLLPVFIAISLSSNNSYLLLTNFILSVCSVPLRMIPLESYYSISIHWLLSVVPLLTHGSLQAESRKSLGICFQAFTCSDVLIDAEILILVPDLHRALVPTLHFLTTTSLLPAELQLLSIGLTNLLLFSTTPQAAILDAILWIGGLSIFLFCRHVLKWAVAIARIPSWRFRQYRGRSKRENTLLSAIDDCLGGSFEAWKVSKGGWNDSDDDDAVPYAPLRDVRRQLSGNTESEIRDQMKPGLGRDVVDTEQAPNRIVNYDSQRTNGGFESATIERESYRRYTLLTHSHTLADGYVLNKSKSRSRIRQRSQLDQHKFFLSLTIAQAQVLKWFYAFWTYVTVILTIGLPIRLYVSKWSLQGNEPVGWALGYLLGDLPFFRLWTVTNNLEQWIRLPSRDISTIAFQGWVETLRLERLGAANTRLLICGYCTMIIAFGLLVVSKLSNIAEVDTRRKIFHGMMVVMFLPTVFIDPAFAALALALVLAIFLLLDLFRASQLPPVSRPLTHFLAPYVDGRDHRGPVIVSHIFLLIGCAIPLWLALSDTSRSGIDKFKGWDVATRDLSMVSGVICVGMGDAAASLIGRRYGRRRWLWSGGKSLEGSLAFALAVITGLSVARLWLLVGGWAGDSGDKWITTFGKASVAAMGASFTEAVLTGGNDNVVVPIILWLLVRGLKM